MEVIYDHTDVQESYE